MTKRLQFAVLDERYALTRLTPGSPHPQWARGRFTAVVQSREGITVVCEQGAVPAGLQTQPNFRCLEVVGAFALESVGVAAAAVMPLAAAGVSVFVYSTWDTDYVLVQDSDLGRAKVALREAGHRIS